jgi:hypothetical protein
MALISAIPVNLLSAAKTMTADPKWRIESSATDWLATGDGEELQRKLHQQLPLSGLSKYPNIIRRGSADMNTQAQSTVPRADALGAEKEEKAEVRGTRPILCGLGLSALIIKGIFGAGGVGAAHHCSR